MTGNYAPDTGRAEDEAIEALDDLVGRDHHAGHEERQREILRTYGAALLRAERAAGAEEERAAVVAFADAERRRLLARGMGYDMIRAESVRLFGDAIAFGAHRKAGT